MKKTILFITTQIPEIKSIEKNLIEPRSQWELKYADQLSSGMDYLNKNAVDLLFLDLAIADSQGGLEFQRIHKKYPQLPIIILAALGQEEIAKKIKQQGAHEYLIKSQLDESNIKRIVKYLLERQENPLEINENQHLLASLIENVPGVIFRCWSDPQRTMEFISKACYSLTGYSTEDLIHNHKIAFIDLIHPEDQEQVRQQIQRSISEGIPLDITYRIIDAKGEQHWVRERGRLFKEKNEIMLDGLLVDVTAQIQREEYLQVMLDLGPVIRNADSLEEVKARLMALLHDYLHSHAAAIGTYYQKMEYLIIENALGDWRKYISERISTNQCRITELIMTKEPLVIQNIDRESSCRGCILATRKAVVCLPLVANQKIIGTLWLGRDTEFSYYELDIILTAVKMADASMERFGLISQMQNQLKRIESLHVIDQAISGIFDIDLISRIILNQAIQQLEVDAADILLLNPVTNTLNLSAEKGFRDFSKSAAQTPIGSSKAGEVVFTRKPISVPNLEEEEISLIKRDVNGEGFKAYFAVPILSKGEVRGVMEVYKRQEFYPNNEWMTFLEALGTQAGIAMENLRMFERLQKGQYDVVASYNATLTGWSKSMEIREIETEGHAERVTEKAVALARAMGLKEDKVSEVERGALLHDVGKIGVLDEILMKKGELSEEDWIAIRRHPEHAYNLLKSVKYLKNSLDIPYCHHEHWDGSGYPRGLTGEEIPLTARIFAVVDTWDSLLSARPYRKAWNRQDVINYLRDQAGKLFDPDVVDKFLTMANKE